MTEERPQSQVEPTPQPDQPAGPLSRRDFIALTALTLTGVAGASLLTAPKARVPAAHGAAGAHKWGMFIDINKCIGCNYCTYACQATNDLPIDMQYNVVTTETTQNGEEYFLSRPCMHCADAPCVHVCPVEATYVRDDGLVMMDYDLCIGCRYCEVACPYQARVFNWKQHTEANPFVPNFGVPEVERRPRGVVEKCTFCVHRIDPALERGLTVGVDPQATPACVVACPTGARVFGDLNDDTSPISKVLAESTVVLRLREELSTEPKVFYLPPRTAAPVEES